MRKIKKYDLIMPKCIKEGWAYKNDETHEYILKTDAPKWAKRDLEEFYRKAKGIYDEKTGMTQLY